MYLSGVSEKDIIAQDGHTNIDITLKHYTQKNIDANERKARMEVIRGNQVFVTDKA